MRHAVVLLAVLLGGPAQAFDYDDGLVLESEDGRFRLKTGMRIQFRGAIRASDYGSPEHALSIPRGRLELTGNAWSEGLSYAFQADWNTENASLEDYYLNYRIGAGVQVRAGQYKKPFNRHQLQSSNTLALIDRAFIDGHYGGGRDVGLMFHNGIAKKTGFEWAIGGFAGHGTPSPPTSIPARIHPLFVARIGLSTPGMDEYSQIDFERGGFRGAVGLNTQIDFDADHSNDGLTRHGLDGIMKIGGLGGQFALFTQTAQSERNNWSAQQIVDYGVFAEANFVVDYKLAPAIRYAAVFAADRDAGTDIEELGGGFTTFFHRHAVKWGHDIGTVTTTVKGRNDVVESAIRVRSQVELAF